MGWLFRNFYYFYPSIFELDRDRWWDHHNDRYRLGNYTIRSDKGYKNFGGISRVYFINKLALNITKIYCTIPGHYELDLS